jgi:hypothetical protein
LVEHVGADVAAECEHCAEIDLQDGLPVVIWEEVRRVASLNAGAVEQDVYSVAVLQDLGDEGGDGLGGGEVGGVDCCFAAQGLDLLFCGLVGSVSLGRVLDIYVKP